MIEAYYDAVGNRRTWVTWGFLAVCVATSVTALLNPEVQRTLTGLAPRRHAWQPFTAAFVHGWPGFSGWLHLPLNALLIVRAGPYTEKLLGSGRFAVLCAAALAANALAVHLTPGGNGASLVIWAWGPPLAWALRVARDADPAASTGPMYLDIRWLLVFLYGILMLGMMVLSYVFGFRGNPLVAFLRANLFHLVAVAVGVLLTFAFRATIERRIRQGGIA
jgi:membrane associated rhomboid family serine protease